MMRYASRTCSPSLFIGDAVDLDPDPAFYSDIWRPKEFLRIGADQFLLRTGRGWKPHCDMSIVVMVVSEHGVYAFVDEEGRLAVGELLSGAW